MYILVNFNIALFKKKVIKFPQQGQLLVICIVIVYI